MEAISRGKGGKLSPKGLRGTKPSIPVPSTPPASRLLLADHCSSPGSAMWGGHLQAEAELSGHAIPPGKLGGTVGSCWSGSNLGEEG